MTALTRLRRSKLFFGSLLTLCAWNALLVNENKSLAPLTAILGLYFCLFLPGLLSVIALGARRLSLQTLLYCFGLSFIFMIIVGLTANYLPRTFGNNRPLSFGSVLLAYNSWLLLIFAWGANNNNGLPRIALPKIRFGWRTSVIYIITIVGILACVGGTFRLNNGADNLLSVAGLCMLMINAALVLLWRKWLPTHTFLIALIGLSWGLLLITSLRSNFISGQDLKQELRVFNITNSAHYWSIANFKDPYNACLSITLYPYVLVKLLGVSADVVFKVVFQLLFAVAPLTIFTLLRSKVSRSLAFVGTIFFLSLPTLGLDLPLQTRQQMAFLLFSLVILTWFHHTEKWITRHWHFLFIIFSFAVIVSHYSTSYIYISTLLLFYVLRSILLTTRYARRRELARGFTLTGRMVLLVSLFAFFWLSQITSTSSNLFSKVGSSISAFVTRNPSNDQSSAAQSIIQGKTNPLAGYINDTKSQNSKVTPQTLSQIKPIDDTLKPAGPLQRLPDQLQNILMTISKKLYYSVGIAIYPLIILIGVIALLARGKSLSHRFTHKPEYVLLSVAIIAVLAIQAVLPGIMNDYGITRAFIQASIILIVPFMFGIKELLGILNNRLTQSLLVFGAFVLFATYSGLTSQLLGGVRPQLNLNNAGPYYGAFYVRRSDIVTYGWIQNNIKFPGNVNAPDYSFPTALAYYPRYVHYGGGILPFQQDPNHYTLLNYTQTKDNIAYTAGSILAVPYNPDSLANNNLIYTNSQSEVYK